MEFFKRGKFYWLKTYTSWTGIICVNSIFKINKNGKILKFYLNTFGFSQGKCKEWEVNSDTKEDFNDWIGLINKYVDTDDEERKVIVKNTPEFK